MNRLFLLTLVAASTCAAVLAAPPDTKPVPALSTFTPASPLVGKPSENPRIDADALALLQKVDKTMLGLKTYQAECRTTKVFDPKPEGKPRADEFEFATLTAVKPNLMRYDAWGASDATGKPSKTAPTYTFVSNGKKAWKQFGPTYRTDTRVASSNQSTILEPWTGFYEGAGSPFTSVTYLQKENGLREVRRDGRETVDGTPCEKIFVDGTTSYNNQAMEYRTTWYISDDGLVRRRVQWVDFGGKGGYTSDATLTKIVLNAPVPNPAQAFAYTPPAGVKSEAQVEQERPKLLTTGTLAPDFSVLDKDSKTLKLSDYRGKVVVLDFWASWCPPCVASMPHTQSVAQKLQSAGLPVVVFAVDNSEAREPFTAWIQKHPELTAITFAHAPREETNIAGKLYNVSGIPTQYIIDPQGKVRASFVGFGGPTDDLEKAVRAALPEK